MSEKDRNYVSEHLDEINATLKNLPSTVINLMPDDAALVFLTNSLPAAVTEANAKTAIAILSLICRRVAVLFNDMASAQEEIVERL